MKQEEKEMLFIKKKQGKAIDFEQVKDHQQFMSNGVIYVKILRQDLKEYGINNVNAVSIVNGGLTYFDKDEKVYLCEVQKIS